MIDDLFSATVKVFTGARASWLRQTALDETRPKVYFANHSSHLDFLLLWAVLPKKLRLQTRPVAARDYWERSAPRKWLATNVFRAALIERAHITRDNNPVEQLSQILAKNESLILFPEGTRSGKSEMSAFKSGLYHLASHHPEVEFVPVYLENLNRVLPKGEVLPIPLICSVSFGESISLNSDETKHDFLLRAREAVDALNPAT
jgi:1-acyl-sn-glycerol-3-phosphate acyltransferase